MENTVIVHYHSMYGNYFDYSMWKWTDYAMGTDANFTSFDSFGIRATIDWGGNYFLSQVYLIIKNQDWSYKSPDFVIKRHPGETKNEIWLIEGDDTVYYSRQAAVTSHAYRHRQPHAFDMAMNSQEFDEFYGFEGWLGFKYTEKQTEFRLWAPTVTKVELVLYDSTHDRSSVAAVLPMKKGENFNPYHHEKNDHGVWFKTVKRDLNFCAYRYRVYYDERHFKDSRDPYSIATTANGRRSVVVSDASLTPQGFEVKQGAEARWRLSNPNAAVIYEMHIRDFTKSETSGVSNENRGKFLGAIQEGTVNQFGQKTGFDYVKELGVSYIQLQPLFDHHQLIEPDGTYKYNWGYDPENYNVPEASFTSNPTAPAQRILELKQLIQAYHDAGIGVIMDVVYNHTYSSYNSAFQLTCPDYYYRMNADGSFQDGTGCGNETASEKEMFRKYMIESILYWVNEYNIDGFRFDLMGIHDVETMNMIRYELDKIDPNIIMYGEGWDMGTGLLPHEKAKKDNIHLMPRIGVFNDNERDAIKGAEVYGSLKAGFVSGAQTEDKIAKSILGSDELCQYLTPSQVINYVEAHDNYNLNDLMLELHPDDNRETHTKRVEMATAMNILMNGVAFIECGQEFMRTKLFPTGEYGQITQADKKRAMNSYNAPDNVNQVNWNNVTYFKHSVDFIKEIIKLKTNEIGFSYESFNEIRNHVYIEEAYSGSGRVIYTITDEKRFKIIFNTFENNSEISMTETENYDIIVTNRKRFHSNDYQLENYTVTVFEIKK